MENTDHHVHIKPVANRISFKEFSDKPDSSIKTQVATTGGTYEKTGKFLSNLLKKGSKIISIGAGLDHTRKALSKGLGDDHGHTIHDMEPNPQGRKEAPEFTKASQIPKDEYHAAVSHNVLNVVNPEVREGVMHSLFNSVKEMGHLVIGTRKWKGDIANTKNYEEGPEEKSAIVKRGATTTYQKGFDGNELKDYVEDFAKRNGHKVEVKKVPLAASGVHVRILKKAKS